MKPTVDVLARLCSALGMTLADFFSEEPSDEPLNVRRLCQEARRLSPEQVDAMLRLIETIPKKER